MVFDAVARLQSGRVLSAKHVRKTIKTQQAASGATASSNAETTPPGFEERFPTLKEAEELHIEEALRRANGNQGIAATLLGISRPALNRRLSRANKND